VIQGAIAATRSWFEPESFYLVRAKEEKLSPGAIVEVIRTVFERKNDMTIYIPDLQAPQNQHSCMPA
jgi:hypothetical protein